jgi:hypothetical protein
VFRTEHFSFLQLTCAVRNSLDQCSARNIFLSRSPGPAIQKISRSVPYGKLRRVSHPCARFVLVFRKEHSACFAQEFIIYTNSCVALPCEPHYAAGSSGIFLHLNGTRHRRCQSEGRRG